MNAEQNKQFTIEIPEGEAQKIEQDAETMGVSTPDFVVYCTRAIAWSINYADRMLPKLGGGGTSDKE